ncbi:hypothetical protein [Streptomyces sp. URMC 129]|uniref:hypothetical protein n=1 Tax=Streptomyces sp. URMC 129 TaxID=3423407 RepID=UPI003F1B99D1
MEDTCGTCGRAFDGAAPCPDCGAGAVPAGEAAISAFPGYPVLLPGGDEPRVAPLAPGESPWAADVALFDARFRREPEPEPSPVAAGSGDGEPRPSRRRLLYVGLLCGVLLGIVVVRADDMPLPVNDSASGAEAQAPDWPTDIPGPGTVPTPTPSPATGSAEPVPSPAEPTQGRTGEPERTGEPSGNTGPSSAPPAGEAGARPGPGAGEGTGEGPGEVAEDTEAAEAAEVAEPALRPDPASPEPERTTTPPQQPAPTQGGDEPDDAQWPNDGGDCLLEFWFLCV